MTEDGLGDPLRAEDAEERGDEDGLTSHWLRSVFGEVRKMEPRKDFEPLRLELGVDEAGEADL